MLDHAAPSRATQLAAVRLEREVIALFAKHSKEPASPSLRRKLRLLVRTETARVERSARAA